MKADHKSTLWNKFIGIVLAVLMAGFVLLVVFLFLALSVLSALAGVG